MRKHPLLTRKIRGYSQNKTKFASIHYTLTTNLQKGETIGYKLAVLEIGAVLGKAVARNRTCRTMSGRQRSIRRR